MIKLVHESIKTHICFCDNWVNLLIVEHPSFFYNCVQDLQIQINGGEGQFVFSQGDKIVKANNFCDIITDAFNIEYNNRKIATALYKLATQNIKEGQLWEKWFLNNNMLLEFLAEVEQSTNLPLEYEDNIELTTLFKAYNLRIKEDQPSFIERLITYTNILAELRNIKILCLVNIKSVLCLEMLQELYKHCAYKKINLILLESHYHPPALENEKVIIIDKDLCEITINYPQNVL